MTTSRTGSAGVRSFTAQLPHLTVGGLEAGDPSHPRVVLLHGFPELSESWRDLLPLLASAGLHAVAPDLRGYGQTDKPHEGYDLDSLSGDVVSLIDHLRERHGGGRAHLVGHDWGGAIAYHTAAHHPDRIERLAVVNCPPPSVMARKLWRPQQLARSWYMFFFQLPFLPERALSSKQGRRIPALMRRAMKDDSRLTRDRAAPYAQNFSDLHATRCALAYYRTMIRGSLTPSGLKRLLRSPPRIEAPFRLVWGTEDFALGMELTRDLEPLFVHPPVIDYLHGVGHFSPIEAPERVASSLLEHLVLSPAGERAGASPEARPTA